MKVRLLAIVILIFTIFNSCKKIQHRDRIREGFIEYKIEYLDDSLDSFMIGLLPKKMITMYSIK